MAVGPKIPAVITLLCKVAQLKMLVTVFEFFLIQLICPYELY